MHFRHTKVPTSILHSRRRRRKARALFWASVFFFVLVALVGLTHVKKTHIAEVEIIGVKTLPEGALLARAETVLDGSYFFIVPKRNVLFYPKEGLLDELMRLSPKIKEARAELEGFSTLRIHIVEREALFLWCRSETVCFRVDEGGYSFETSKEEDIGTLVLLTVANPPACGTGCAIISPKALESVLIARRLLGTRGAKVVSAEIDENNDYTLTLSEGTRILFAGDNPITEVLDNLFSLMQSDVFRREGISFESGLEKIDYIDVRYGKKLFYKPE